MTIKKQVQKPRKAGTPPHIKRQIKEKLFADCAPAARETPEQSLTATFGKAQMAWNGWQPHQCHRVLTECLHLDPEMASIIQDRPWFALGLHVKRRLKKLFIEKDDMNPALLLLATAHQSDKNLIGNAHG